MKKQFDPSNINTVLFDFDGTLLDSNGLIADTWRHTVRNFTGKEISDDEIRDTIGEMLIDSMRRMMPEVNPEEAVEFYRVYQRGIFLDRVRLFEGTEKVLRALKAAGFKTAIVTNRLKSSTHNALEHFEITELFDFILTASEMEKFKPDPEPIYKALEQLNSKPEEAIFVGDSNHDIEAGNAAGVFTILVNWSFGLPPGELRENASEPDTTISELEEILVLLGV